MWMGRWWARPASCIQAFGRRRKRPQNAESIWLCAPVGPHLVTALEYARRLDANGWHIFQNGASIVNLATRQSRSVSIPPSCVKKLIAQARESAETLELYSDDDYV